MADADELAVLKSGPNRTVLLEQRGSGDPRLVKRFHARRFHGRWRDRGRARGELALLAALRAAGLPVPEPLELRRGARGWELVCGWIPAAVSLQELYLGRARWPCAPERLAGELGRLLARAHAAGLDQRDLHAGNVLVDSAGELWLVDFTKARLRARLPERARERDLAVLAAGAREALPFGFRARVLVAWGEGRPAGARGALAARIEARARARRREIVRRGQDRWRRASGVCRSGLAAGAPLLTRADLSEDRRTQLGELLARRSPGAPAEELERGGASDRLLLSWPRPAHALRVWAGAGRMDDHRLPCARPLGLRQGRPAVAAFELPAGARRPRELPAAGAGRLAGALWDRGLLLRSLPEDSLWLGAAGELVLDPRARLTSAPGRMSRALGARGAAGLSKGFAAGGREAFVEAFVGELRGGPAERRRLRAELSRG